MLRSVRLSWRDMSSFSKLLLTATVCVAWSSTAHADLKCSFQDPTLVPSSDVSLAEIMVRLPNESDFHAPDPALCGIVYLPTGNPTSRSVMTYINLASNAVSNVELAPSYPEGTELKLIYSFNRANLSWGSIAAGASAMRVEYGDEVGGDPNKLTVVVKTQRELLPSTPNISLECLSQLTQINSWAYVMVNYADRNIREWSQVSDTRVLMSSRTRGLSYPQFSLSDAGGLSYEQTVRICPQGEAVSDGFTEAFFPSSALALSGLTSNLVSGIPEDIFPLMFEAFPSGGMKVRNFTVRYSYGERTNLAGVATSTTPTGVIFRLETDNNGFGYGSAGALRSLRGPHNASSSEQRAFRLTRAARNVLSKCTAGKGKKKKFKKNAKLVKRGKGVACKLRRSR